MRIILATQHTHLTDTQPHTPPANQVDRQKDTFIYVMETCTAPSHVNMFKSKLEKSFILYLDKQP